MGLPKIDIRFESLAATAIKRSGNGVVALILKDDTKNFDTKEYTNFDEVKAEDWTTTNLDYISKAFLQSKTEQVGVPAKVIIERIPVNSENYTDALERLKNKKWNYLAIPGIKLGDTATIVDWVKKMRDVNNKVFKCVLPNTEADCEGIINFATEDIVVGDKTYSASEYTARIAGILAGIPFTRSSTYFRLDEIDSIKESLDPDEDVDAGKLILINDGSGIKIGRGVNSLKTTSKAKGESFKKIKIVEAIDLMREDIRTTFENEYVGKVTNTYDNKILFLTSINDYLKLLQYESVLNSDMEAKVRIDSEAQKKYLISKGIDITNLKDQEIKEYNTDSRVFICGSVSPLDAMEDLEFGMIIA
ncbi:phage tail sheath C-terminal domain-containing protein [Clostridium sp. MB40-C1]|uniref:phage tail sheath subtilisin-like domain-containing protein n=1 Tax=Clostridium sp. MB40-C1 TaxID=3070996 RepID=UPI0027DF2415|nr:phage tail sheath subtilisin-like domain-containing protein [Clostridium sp. MB40-C1]WMJ80990.1 phage tail sheath C-terminal domain-containing protein [Clostridium sp. MB40-C1]